MTFNVNVKHIKHLFYASDLTLENHCTRTAQSLRGGCSRRVHTIVYLAVEKGNILVNISLLQIILNNF